MKAEYIYGIVIIIVLLITFIIYKLLNRPVIKLNNSGTPGISYTNTLMLTCSSQQTGGLIFDAIISGISTRKVILVGNSSAGFYCDPKLANITTRIFYVCFSNNTTLNFYNISTPISNTDTPCFYINDLSTLQITAVDTDPSHPYYSTTGITISGNNIIITNNNNNTLTITF